MKLVILTDIINLEGVNTALGDKRNSFIATEPGDICHEYTFVFNMIDNLQKTETPILLVLFSGRDSVAKMLGDESSEMIVTVTGNQNSAYYTTDPVGMIEELLNTLEQGE